MVDYGEDPLTKNDVFVTYTQPTIQDLQRRLSEKEDVGRNGSKLATKDLGFSSDDSFNQDHMDFTRFSSRVVGPGLNDCIEKFQGSMGGSDL